MRLKLTMTIDNAAFEESASAELARIFRELADAVVMHDLNKEDAVLLLNVRDINGNKVGELSIG